MKANVILVIVCLLFISTMVLMIAKNRKDLKQLKSKLRRHYQKTKDKNVIIIFLF
jgi:hypothetical protein